MTNLYLTADDIGAKSGGGVVTWNESEALKTLGPCEVWGRDYLCYPSDYFLEGDDEEPWKWDNRAVYNLGKSLKDKEFPKVAHVYAGTFSKTVFCFKTIECKVSYTAAAHDIQKSKQAHEELGIPFNYPHLTDPTLWSRYVAGYVDADVVICPSQHSANVMASYGCRDIVVIPHGVDLPDHLAPFPSRFTVGYLGSYGCDKGVVDILKAWKKLNYKDAALLLAGRDSTSPWVQHLIQEYGGGNIHLLGWVDKVADFYNQISVLVQASRSEGFGIEVLESMAHGRPVICSTGAGACDVVPEGWKFPAGNAHRLAEMIDQSRSVIPYINSTTFRRESEKYTWPIIRQLYVDVWKVLLNKRNH